MESVQYLGAQATRYPSQPYSPSPWSCPSCGGQVDIDRRFCLVCGIGIAEGSGWPLAWYERIASLWWYLGADIRMRKALVGCQ